MSDPRYAAGIKQGIGAGDRRAWPQEATRRVGECRPNEPCPPCSVAVRMERAIAACEEEGR
jgi:hypothetical protein